MTTGGRSGASRVDGTGSSEEHQLDLGSCDVDIDDTITLSNWPLLTGFAKLPPCVHNELKDHFIIAQELDGKTVLAAINGIMDSNAASILKGEGVLYKVPSRDKKNIAFEKSAGLLLGRGGTITYDLGTKKLKKTTGITCVLSVVHEAVSKGVTVTVRDVFYRNRDVFGSKQFTEACIYDVCCLLGCDKASLNLVSFEKGSVIGPLKLKLTNGEVASCSELSGRRIPSEKRLLEVESFDCGDAEFILVVEKQSLFHHLSQMDFHNKQRCIMVTGNGVPDIATRVFLKRLVSETKLPHYALMDPDPDGFMILCVYAYGSANLAFDISGLAVPTLRWLGLWVEDLIWAGIGVTQLKDVTPREEKMLSNLLGNKNLSRFFPRHWSVRFQDIALRGKKASFEILHSKGFDFVSKVFLPALLNKRRNNETVDRERNAVTVEKSLRNSFQKTNRKGVTKNDTDFPARSDT